MTFDGIEPTSLHRKCNILTIELEGFFSNNLDFKK